MSHMSWWITATVEVSLVLGFGMLILVYGVATVREMRR